MGVDGEESESIPVASGGPRADQGPALCPILFLVYTNDLPDEVRSQVRLFADDTALYLTLESEDDCSTLQSDLDILSTKESKWESNPSKCQVMHVTGSRLKGPIKTDYMYLLHGQFLWSFTCTKVDISSDLSRNSHVDRITGNANRTLGCIRRNI